MKKIQNIIFVSCFDPINLAMKQFIEEKISCYHNCTISLLPVSTYNSHLTKAVDKIEMLKICFENKVNVSDILVDKEIKDFKKIIKDNFKNFIVYNLDPISYSSFIPAYDNSLGVFDFINNKLIPLPDEIYPYILKNDLYFLKDIKNVIDDERYKHCKSVAITAYKIAQGNNLNKYDALYAGLLHDIAKGIPKDMLGYYSSMKGFDVLPLFAYHQLIAANIVRERYVTSQDVINGIEYHCTGRKDMSLFEKCIYAADKVEPNREFDTKELREACIEDLEKGFKRVLADQVKYFKEHNKSYLDCKYSVEMYHQYGF